MYYTVHTIACVHNSFKHTHRTGNELRLAHKEQTTRRKKIIEPKEPTNQATKKSKLKTLA